MKTPICCAGPALPTFIYCMVFYLPVDPATFAASLHGRLLMPVRALPADERVMSTKSHRHFGVAVQLDRDGSGGHIICSMPHVNWNSDMHTVTTDSYGNLCIVMHPTARGVGVDKSFGVMLSIVPGNLQGKAGGHGARLRQPLLNSQLPGYGSAGGTGYDKGDLALSMDVESAQRVHKHLGRVIANARRLSRRAKLQNAA